MKKVLVCIMILSIVLSFVGCRSEAEKSIIDRVYTYEGEGFGGDFVITINKDGTYTYAEGPSVSSPTTGTWKVKDEKVILTDDKESGYAFVNVFGIREGDLVFLEDESSNFYNVKISNGALFYGANIE